MAKVSLKEVTRELADGAAEMLGRARNIRLNADYLFDALKRMDSDFSRQKEEENARRRQPLDTKELSLTSKASP